MKRLNGLGNILFLLTLPWYAWVLYHDLTHPEIWDQDWQHDPRIYLPFSLVVLVFCVAVMRKVLRERRELQRKIKLNATLKELIEQVRQHQAARRIEEARATLQLLEELIQRERQRAAVKGHVL